MSNSDEELTKAASAMAWNFQWRFMLYVSLFIGAAFAAVYASNLLFFDSLDELGIDLGLSRSHPYFEYIQDQRDRLMLIFLGVCCVAFAILFLAGFVLARKLIGPVLAVQVYFDRLDKEGVSVGAFELKDQYFFPDLENTVNKTVSEFRENWMPAERGDS